MRQYEARRRTGGIALIRGVTGQVGQRTVQADIKLLKQMLRWACTRTMPNGHAWLDRNPLEYVRVNGERDPQRPIADVERFEATRNAMRQRQRRYAAEATQATSVAEAARARRREQTWIRAELGLRLLEATGRRRRAVMGLQWNDFDFDRATIRWRAAFDKSGRDRVVPYSAELMREVRILQAKLEALHGFVFAREGDPTRPAPAELLSQWIVQAEHDAGLPKLAGGVTHPYRRKWRSERGDLPVKAVMEAGGWSDLATMPRCYDHPDDAALLAVTASPRKRHQIATA